ncbi:ATP-binding protein [Desertivirga brevis]|uniref:ATP-binding protein n=1 Tax=Desertivirga brevis TaxID=2810310 RepID=UPI001A974CD5|nr:ATP-binding protein [Pedobacter sp. SYSU D00873]
MKKLFPLLILAVVSSAQAQHQLVKLWETDSLAIPESVLPNFNEKMLYVSLIDGVPNAADGKGGIAKVGMDGKITNASWVTGLNAPKGMGKHGNKLYVADLTEVVVVNASSGKVETRIPAEGSVFLNDVAIDNKGVVYVSDTRTGKIYRIKNDKAEIWMENISDANGLKMIGNDLYILSGTKMIRVNQEKVITTIAQGFAKNGDGLEPLKNGDFIVSCWSGLVYYVSSNGQIELLLDTQESKINTADIGLDRDKNIVYIPTFNNKTVIAYQLKNNNK